MNKIILPLLILCLILIACGGGSSGGGGGGDSEGGGDGSGDNNVINIQGDWTGTWVSSRTISWGTISITLTQKNTSINGTGSIINSPCIANANVSGSISENNVTFSLVSGAGEVYYDGTVNGSKMSGIYIFRNGACVGDDGSYRLTKR